MSGKSDFEAEGLIQKDVLLLASKYGVIIKHKEIPKYNNVLRRQLMEHMFCI